jgi:hypothetical protein
MFRILPSVVSKEIWDYIIEDDGSGFDDDSCIDLIGYMIAFLPDNVTVMRDSEDWTPFHSLLFDFGYGLFGENIDPLPIEMKRKLLKLGHAFIGCRMTDVKNDGN